MEKSFNQLIQKYMREHKAGQKRFRWEWAAVCFLFLGAGFMLLGYKAQLFKALPYLLILACPLLHLFMHKNHDHK